MSVKIWVAYKLKPQVTKDPAKFWKWVRETQARGEAEVQKVIRKLYGEMVENLKTDSEEYIKSLGENGKDDYYHRLTYCHDALVREFKRQGLSSLRSLFDFDVTIAIRELDGDLYVTPYCDMLCRNVLDFMKEDKRLVDFAYWNNTDPPEGMRQGAGYKRWEARGKVWDRIDPHIREYLSITVCDFQKFMYVDPWLDMVREEHSLRKSADKTEAAGEPDPTP